MSQHVVTATIRVRSGESKEFWSEHDCRVGKFPGVREGRAVGSWVLTFTCEPLLGSGVGPGVAVNETAGAPPLWSSSWSRGGRMAYMEVSDTACEFGNCYEEGITGQCPRECVGLEGGWEKPAPGTMGAGLPGRRKCCAKALA